MILAELTALLPSAFGGAMGLLPSVMKIFSSHLERKHELALMKLQNDANTASRQDAIFNTQIEAYGKTLAASHQSMGIGLKNAARWASTLSATVRPVLTYALFSAKIWVMIALFLMVAGDGVSIAEASIAIWDDEMNNLLQMVFSFWFVDRALLKRNTG